jgi:hypothetical protein
MYYADAEAQAAGSVTIRPAQLADADAVRRVAQRDSRGVPAGDLLIAAVGTEIRAAISVQSGEVIADPFRRTEDLVRMLALRRSQMAYELPPTSRGLTLKLA